MIRYTFRDDAPLCIKAADKADPQVIGEALQEISSANRGRLEPEAVWKAAKARGHPLHKHFEWDVQKAAEAHWTDQARGLIRIIRIEEPEQADPVRAFLSVRDETGTAYRPTASIRRSADMQAALLKQAERDLDAFERRYRSLADICAIVVEAREAIRRRLDDNETRAAA